jgi:tetratricopeptide (TPR) repeat protein
VAGCAVALSALAATRSTWVQLWRAERAIGRGDLGAAAAMLARLARDGEDPRAVTLLARVWLLQGKPAAVVRLVEKRFETRWYPDWLPYLGEAYLALGETGKAGAAFKAAVHERPNDVNALVYLAKLSYREGDLGDSLDAYRQLARIEPRKPDWPRALGLIYIENDDYEKAREFLSAAVALDPADFESRYGLARAEFLLGEIPTSLANLDRCLAARPMDSQARIARADCLRASDRLDEAVGELEQVIVREPENPTALRLLAEIHLDRRELDPALRLLETARRVALDDWRVHYQLSRVYDGLGRPDDARGELEVMRELQKTAQFKR